MNAARRPYRVLRVIADLDARAGGPPASALASAMAAARAGITTHVAYCEVAGAPIDDRLVGAAHAAGVEFRPFPPAPGRLQRHGASWPLLRFVASSGSAYDVIHAHGAWVAPSLLAAASRSHRAVVLTPHESLTDHDVLHARTPIRSFAKRALRHALLSRVDAIVFSSVLESRSSGLRPHRSVQSVVVPHVVEPSEVPGLMNVEGHLRVGFLGRLVRKKRVDVLLRAVAVAGRGIELSVAGVGPEEARLRNLASELGISASVEWLGFVAPERRHVFLEKIDVMCLPSDYECFGMAAAEAMAAGRPVLVTPEVGIAEVVARAGGGWIEAQVPDALGARLRALTEAPEEVARMGTLARTTAMNEFSYETHGAALRSLYDSLLDRGSSSSV